MPHAQVGDRLAALLAPGQLDDVGAHRPQHVQQPSAARVHAHPPEHQLGTRHDAGGDDEERRRGEIRGHLDVARLQREAAEDRGLARDEGTGRTERRQHALAVVAGGMRLAHVRLAICVQARQQQRRLHLRAGHRQGVVDAAQRLAATDPQRRAAILGLDHRAHRRQRLDHPPHRPRRQRRIADQHAVEALARQQAGEQAHRGARIAAVQRPVRGLQAMQAHPVDDADAVRRRLDAHAEPTEDRRGRARVLALEEALDAGRALGDRAQHDRAVADRLVAGHRQFAAQGRTRRGDPGTAHAITSSRVASRRAFSAAVPMVMRRHSPSP